MRTYTLENNIDRLTHQAVHMDQAVCYCPEFIATREMASYPSRVAQTGRAVWLGELAASERAAEVVFAPILSAQGERWQNFGEDSADFFVVDTLLREVLLKKGLHADRADGMRALIAQNGGHAARADADAERRWEESIPLDAASGDLLLLDDAACAWCSHSAYETGLFLSSRGVSVREARRGFDGLEYLASGLVDEGLAALEELVRSLERSGAKRVITVSGRTEFMLTRMCALAGIPHELRVTSLLALADSLECSRAYLQTGSFYARLLAHANAEIERLVSLESDEPVANSREFTPLVSGRKRVTRPTIWTEPLCAAFARLGDTRALDAEILKNGLAAIARSGCSQVVAFDAFEYRALMNGPLAPKTAYYASLLK